MTHEYFWDFIKKQFPQAVEQDYAEGIELDFYPSQAAKDSDVAFLNLYSCHRDLETGELKIYTAD